jgi:hypothetical protein
MATTVGSHSVSTFATPVNGGPLDANVVRGNDNTIRTAYVAHDADTGIHVQSSTLASRPSAGTAGRKWITADTGIYKLWYDDGTTWHEVGASTIDVYVLADENLVKGDVIKITGYNVGNGAPRVAKVSSASDVAFGIVNGTIASGAVGYVTNTGLIIDVNTNSFAIGDILYPNTSGGLTTTKPTSGNYQPVAFVLRSNQNNGVLYVEFSTPRIVERSDNTASTVVLRDASGNFSAGTITAGALTSTGLVTFASLKGTGATTVTNILDEDTMSSDSATALATQQSIKAYVDAQVATVDTLAEVLANGNTTGANNIIVTAGQKITTNTIDETTAGSGVTIDSVLLKDDVVNATDIETGTISANDGTTSATIANSTGVMTIASSVLTTTDINGGTVDGVTIGGASAGAGTFTNLTASGTVNLTGATVSNGGSVTTIDINGGTIDGTTIGGASAAAGTFTTINATSINATTFDMTNLEVTNIKAKDGTASMTIADTTGDVTVSAALVANGNVTLGNATSDTITVGGSFPTGTKLRTDSSVGNTLAVSAYDVDGTAYVDLVTATASNTPTLALTSTGVGSMNNIAIGGTTPAAGAFTTLDASGDFAIATNKFTVASASGNTAVAGTLTTTGTLTSNGNTVIGSDAADTITANAQFVTGTQLKSAQSAGNTLALAAYDVDGTAYTSLVTLTAGNTPTLTMTSVGTGSLNNVTIGGSTAAAGTFTNLTAQTDLTIGTDVVLSRGAANRLDLASGDSLNIVSGNADINGALTVSGDLTVDTSTLKVDSSGNRVLIGTTSAVAVGGQTNKLQVVDVGGVTGGASMYYYSADGGFNTFNFAKSRGATDGSFTIVNNNDALGSIIFAGADGSAFQAAASISARVNGAPSAGDMPGCLVFSTTADGASSPTERARIDASGNLGLGVTPSAWDTLTAFQVKNASFSGFSTAATVAANAYYQFPDWKYITTAAAGYYTTSGGSHEWYSAASGTAGNTITFGSAKMTLDASGNLLVGTTTSGGLLTLKNSNPSASLISIQSYANTNEIGDISFDQATDLFVISHKLAAGGITFQTNSTERARIDASGNLGVGTASPTAYSGYSTLAVNGSNGGQIDLMVGGANKGALFSSSTGIFLQSTSGSSLPLVFRTDSTERARITSGGYFKASNTGTYANATGSYHELRTDLTNAYILYAQNTASSIPYGIYIKYTAASPNAADNNFLYCEDSTAVRAIIRSNGGLANYQSNNTDLSDIRTKTDIASLGSMWDKVAALEIVSYKYVDQTHDDVNLGVIAQQVEAVEPVWVDSDGFGDTPEGEEPMKTVYTKDITFAAIKALQEAMARIEALEVEVAALKAGA